MRAHCPTETMEVINKDDFNRLIERDTVLEDINRKIIVPFSNKKSAYLEELSKKTEDAGVIIVTLDDKIEECRQALEFLKNRKGIELNLSDLWFAIGEQYKKAGDILQGSASFTNALFPVEVLECLVLSEPPLHTSLSCIEFDISESERETLGYVVNTTS